MPAPAAVGAIAGGEFVLGYRFLTNVDIAVIGGGPAGCATALSLLRHTSRRVLVIERSGYDEVRPGESLSPGVAAQLKYIDAAHLLNAAGQLPAYGTAAAWGSPHAIARDSLYTPHGQGWHLDRARFDRALATLVEERGGERWTHARLRRAARDGGEWRLDVANAKGQRARPVRARFVIDATGRDASFARRQGARRIVHDRLFGLSRIGRLHSGVAGPDAFTVVESVEDGWWYSARLPGDRVAVTLMTDPDVVRRYRWHRAEAWEQALQATSHTAGRAHGVTFEDGVRVSPAFSQTLTRVAGAGWIAVGEAAAGFDPLSSMGIGYAIASGIQGARAADAALAGDHAYADAYARSVHAHVRQIRARQREMYAMERRWPEAPFWVRRLPPGAEDPGLPH